MSCEVLPHPLSNKVAHFPYSLEFVVEDKSGVLRNSAKIRHTQDLFFVSCSVQPHHQRREWMTVFVGSSTSQRSVEIAKCYILAMCSPKIYSDLSCRQPGNYTLAGLLFSEHSKLHAILEAKFLACIQLLKDQDGSFIRVQGEESHVDKAMSQLRSMLDTIENRHHHHSSPATPSPSFSPPPHPQNGEGDSINAELLRAMLDTVERRVPNPRHHHHHHHHHHPPSSSSGSPPFLSRTPELPALRKRVDYYVQQLGFPREIVAVTLESLGPGAHDNDILNRLNQRMKGTPVVPLPPAPPPFEEPVISQVTAPGVAVMDRLQRRPVDPSNLRPIVIDGSNVAMRHGNGQIFSCRGIQIVVDYFKARGHNHIKVFVPEWRKESSRPETPISGQHILEALEKANILSYTPSRKINGRRIVCYDDRYIVKYAHLEGGVIISNDQYRDLMLENLDWRKVIEQHLLQFTFANDHFMPPDDPLGKNGPTLDQFLVKDPRELQVVPKKPSMDSRSSSMPVCPHLGNCTFGRKCRYYHPDREPQKTEHVTGGGSSGSSYTPSTSSRSATPSPSPDSRVFSSKSSREDLYGGGQFSAHSSLDDLHRERMFNDSSPGVDIAELSEKLAQSALTSPTKGPYLDSSHSHSHAQLGRVAVKFPHPNAVHVKSAPVLETMSQCSPQVMLPHGDGPRPHNHTFPIAQVPQVRNVRSGNVTEDHTFHINTHHLNGTSYDEPPNHVPPSHAPPGHAPPGHVPPSHAPPGHAPHGNSQSLLPRDVRQNAPYPPQPCYSSSQGGYPHGNDYVDSAHLRRDVHHMGGARVGMTTPSYSSHPVIAPYDQHRGVGGVSSDQSIPLHNLHQQHFSSTNHQPHPHGYALHSGYQHMKDAAYGPRQQLYRMAHATFPNCKDRINAVMQSHPELTDFQMFVEYFERLS